MTRDQCNGNADHESEDEFLLDGVFKVKWEMFDITQGYYDSIHDGPDKETIDDANEPFIFQEAFDIGKWQEQKDSEQEGDHIMKENSPGDQ